MYLIPEHIRYRFRDHVVTTHYELNAAGAPDFEYLEWRNRDGSSNGLIRYVRHQQLLCVYGDFYEAVYGWNGEPQKDLRWMAELDFGYFHSKCVASRNGSRPYEWDAAIAAKELERYLQESCSDHERKIFKAYGATDHISDADEWQAWLIVNQAEMGDEGQDYYADLCDIGKVPDRWCMMHLAGLQLALVQDKRDDNGPRDPGVAPSPQTGVQSS